MGRTLVHPSRLKHTPEDQEKLTVLELLYPVNEKVYAHSKVHTSINIRVFREYRGNHSDHLPFGIHQGSPR
jgi:hypothetical protein